MSDETKREELSRLKQRLIAVAVCVWFLVAVLAVHQAMASESVERPFNQEDLTGWKLKDHDANESHWTVGGAELDAEDPRELVVGPGEELVNAGAHGVDIYTEAVYGDHVIDLEVLVARGSNSGIYVHGEYEVQVLDSYGREENPSHADMGGIYSIAPPQNPRYLEPGQWNTFRIEFRAPRFDASGQKTANAVFEKVVLNDRVIHENLEVDRVTPGGIDGQEKAEGPLMFQGDHGPVSFRNIRVKPLE